MGKIQLSAEELDRLGSKAKAQMNEVVNLIQAGDGAISASGDLRSNAMTDFENGWRDDKIKLGNLRDDLQKWSEYCGKQANTARQLNQPFRSR